MTIPTASNYPDELDTDTNLYRVRDSLRVRLLEDYLPGDTSITIEGDATAFPPTGIITLTDQVSDIDERAVSFWYAAHTATGFSGLELLPGFTDVGKSKGVTNVTMNVMARHHNSLKDALIAAETFAGRKGTIDLTPLGPTLEGRIGYLRRLALRPRAWFEVSKRIGIVPLTVVFTDLSFRNPTFREWDFGDGTTFTSDDPAGGGMSMDPVTFAMTKTFYDPGVYDITLRVTNENGEDELVIPNYITARLEAPDEAVFEFAPDAVTQEYISGVLTTRTGAVVNVGLTSDGQQTGDPITSYDWDCGDDLDHGDAPVTKAVYSIGGTYDMRLRVGTLLNAYRTTIAEAVVNVVERRNLWLFAFPDATQQVTKDVSAYEFGLLSETFKTASRSTQSVKREYTLVDDAPEASRKVREYLRNVGFAPRNQLFGSGDKGVTLLYWSEGDVAGELAVRFKQYTGFTDTWGVPPGLDTLDRGWNWVGLSGTSKAYLILGTDGLPSPPPPGTSPTNQTKHAIDLTTLTVSSQTMDTSWYRNGAEDLMQNSGFGTEGDFSVYRSCWRGQTGYFCRNDGVGSYFHLLSFYRTEGTLSDEFQFIRKLPPLPGSTKLEGQLVAMADGIFFFNNTGEYLQFDIPTGVWHVGGPGINSSPFRSLQDQTVDDYDNPANTLVAASDGDRKAYLSFDYTTAGMIRFDATTATMATLPPRPTGEQWVAGVY